MNVDRKHKLVRRYHVSDAAQHDSQAVDHLLMQGNTGAGVWADSAYRSEEMEAKLRARKLKSHIHRKGRDYPIFCVRGRFSSLADEPLAEHDGELGLGLGPFAGRAFPVLSRAIESQI